MTMPIPEGSAVTTPNQMLAELQHVVGELRELRGTLAPTLSQLQQQVQKHDAEIQGQDGAIDKLENRATALETTVSGLPRSAVSWTALAGVIGLLLTALGVIAAFLVLTIH